MNWLFYLICFAILAVYFLGLRWIIRDSKKDKDMIKKLKNK